jgi:bacterioferritin-associated ferredoxin
MDANVRKTRRAQADPKSSWQKSEPRGFAGMDPGKMGLEMPEWLTPTPEGTTSLPEEPAPVPHPCGQARTVLEGMKVVCICKGIRKSVFWKVLDSGVQTKADVNRLTGAGSGGCQGRRCGPRILEMLRDVLGSS